MSNSTQDAHTPLASRATGSPALPGLDASTLPEMFLRTVAVFADQPALRSADGALELSWDDYAERSRRIAGGLHSHGVRAGDSVACLLTNRVEFHLIDVAALRLGAVLTSIYPTAAPEQIAHQINDSGARFLITEQALLSSIDPAGLNLDTLAVIEPNGEPHLSLGDLENSAPPGFSPETAGARVASTDLANLIYTSGTTGPAKGVELTHANLINTVRGMDTALGLRPGGRTISYLPHAHLADRMATHYCALAAGTCITCIPDHRQLAAALTQVRPTHFLAVPRIWEKLHAALQAELAAHPDPTVTTALDTALQLARAEQARAPIDPALAARTAEYQRTVLADLRARIGLDHIDFAYTGAAPIRADVHEFFLALGIPVCEAWGMTETSVMGTLCRPDAIRVGTVGTAFPGLELRLADDGEILLRGPNIMRGYRNLPERTSEVLDPQGWLATGDIGRIDPDGYLTIIDRKKELIINSAGKNMSPATIETTLTSSSPLIGQACCIGDARPYNVALLVLDPDGCATFAAGHGWDDPTPAALAHRPEIRAEIDTALAKANARLARVEQIKRYALLDVEWVPGGPELTPTMKLKRKPITQKYHDHIEALYRDDRPAPS